VRHLYRKSCFRPVAHVSDTTASCGGALRYGQSINGHGRIDDTVRSALGVGAERLLEDVADVAWERGVFSGPRLALDALG
jgi:hypothetical protein